MRTSWRNNHGASQLPTKLQNIRESERARRHARNLVCKAARIHQPNFRQVSLNSSRKQNIFGVKQQFTEGATSKLIYHILNIRIKSQRHFRNKSFQKRYNSVSSIPWPVLPPAAVSNGRRWSESFRFQTNQSFQSKDISPNGAYCID